MPVDPAAIPNAEVQAPATIDELAGSLRTASAAGKRILAAGGGCFLDLGGRRAAPTVVVRTTGLNRTVFHEPQELVAKVEAGMTLAALNALLGQAGQELPWDHPWPERQTIGGILASGIAGARRLGFGAPKDHVLGVTAVLTDGRIIRPGGRVMKNVAGYDLTRLLVGSRGSLGVIAEAALKVKPLPEEAVSLTASFTSPADAATACRAVLEAGAFPAFLELRGRWQHYELATGAEGLKETVQAQAAKLKDALRAGAKLEARAGHAAMRGLLEAWSRQPWESKGPVFRVSVPRGRIGKVLDAVEGPVYANAGSGVIRVAPGRDLSESETRDLLARLHAVAHAEGGSAGLERGLLPQGQEEPGLAPRLRELGREIRAAFDPAGALAGGRS